MPKLSNRPPKYAKLKNYAVVYLHGKIHYLGHYGSPESKTAYRELVIAMNIDFVDQKYRDKFLKDIAEIVKKERA